MVTTELRYFFRNSLSEPWEEMIESYSMKREEKRDDWYLSLNRSSSCGIKWREGYLEAKSLVKRFLHDEWPMEVWEKKRVAPLSDINTEENWIVVSKTRHVVYLDSSLRKMNEPPTGHLNCQVEISECELHQNRFHSFCIECSGGRQSEHASFVSKCIAEVLREFPEAKASIEKSAPYSYPEFLLHYTTCT